ncbi:glutathione S-transferase E14-like isoform X2 [Anopheles merus]|uniref:glutathione transferase n=2 Tax=Anopheles merus TaxID=30066 RepID=A0A182UQ45_ANOME|nr:glutathione S-transferase E14-like isoform X2 [Anopheles merus]XP_041780366.1 glutathione S-transferase E14-like isoform X2 [Anopheles merus]
MTTSPAMILYYDEVSPPVRGVLLAIAALGVKDRIKLEYIDLFKGGHLSSDYLKINPLHTVPVLRHGELTLTDSHAILVYLCDAFAPPGHTLALPDALTRAKVFNMLCFNNGCLFQRDAEVMRKIFSGAITDPTQHLKSIEAAIDALEQFLQRSRYTAHDQLSVADFAIVATLSTVAIFVPLVTDRWPRVCEWFAVMEALPYYNDQNRVGLDMLRKHLAGKVKL